MKRLTSWDPANQEVLINEEEKILSQKGFITDEEMYEVTRHLAEKLFDYENKDQQCHYW